MLLIQSLGRTMGPKRRLRIAREGFCKLQARVLRRRAVLRYAVMKRASLVISRHMRGKYVRNHYGGRHNFISCHRHNYCLMVFISVFMCVR